MTPTQRDAACDAFNMLKTAGRLKAECYQFVESNFLDTRFHTRPGFEKAWHDMGLTLPNYSSTEDYVFLWEMTPASDSPFKNPQLIEVREFIAMASGLPNPFRGRR